MRRPPVVQLALRIGLGVLAWGTTPVTATAQSSPTSAPTTAPVQPWTAYEIISQSLGEPRQLFVHTPAGYDTVSRRYPVLVINDAHDPVQFRAAIANAEFLADRGMVPPMLIVGIPKGKDRTRDLTPATPTNPQRSGRVDAFLDFVSGEALPLVRERYRTTPYTVFAGHSLAGLTGLWAAATRPAQFNAIVAMSPSLWWDDYRYQAVLADSIARRTLPLRLFTSRGGIEADIDSSTGVFERRLDAERPKGRGVVKYQHRRYAEDFHSLTPLASLIDGLRAVFDGYATTGSEYQRINPSAWTDSASLMSAVDRSEARWARSAREFPASVTGEASRDSIPPESLYLSGVTFSDSRNPRTALAIARRAAERYPASSAVQRVLGERLLLSADSVAARSAFRRALTVARTANDSAAVRAAAGPLVP